MILRTLFVFIPFFLFCLAELAFSIDLRFLDFRHDRILGKIFPKTKGDTLLVKYDFIINEGRCDSMAISLVSNLLPLDSVDKGTNSSIVLEISNFDNSQPEIGRRWKGEISISSIKSGVPEGYRLQLFGLMDDKGYYDTVFTKHNIPFYPSGFFGGRLNMGIAFASRNGFSAPIKNSSKNAVLHCDYRYGYFQRNYTLFIGNNINYSKSFSLLEWGKFESEIHPWGRDNWLPTFHMGLSYARVKGFNEPVKFVKKGWGVEAGINFEGPFEGLKYSYNTGAGGFHRADLAIALVSRHEGDKIGTMFSIYHGKYVRMIAVSVFAQGWGQSNSLEYKNTRPVFHKALAWLAIVPFIPIAIAGQG